MEAILEAARNAIAAQVDAEYKGGLVKFQHNAQRYLQRAYQIRNQLDNLTYENTMLGDKYLTNAFDKFNASITKITSQKEIKAATDKIIAYTRWQAARDMLYENSQKKSIENLMKESYTLIEEYKKITTGHNPSYHVVFSIGRGKNKKIYEGDLPLSAILESAQLQSVWKNSSAASAFKLRLVDTLNIRSKWLKQYADSLIELQDETLTQYNNIMNQIKNLPNQGGPKITNEGNKFEIYRKYLIRKQSEGDNGTLLKEIAQEVLSNTKSFANGEDFEYTTLADNWLMTPTINLQNEMPDTQISRYESLKSFMGSDPSLASLSTLISTLESICISVGSDITQIQSNTKSILSSEIRDDGSLTKILKEEIEEEVKKYLSSLIKI